MKYVPTVFALIVIVAPLTLRAQMMVSHEPTANTAPGDPSSNIALDRPVARVNGAILTQRDLLREMYTIFPYARQHNGSVPKAMEADIRNGALKMIVFEELVYQEALRRGLRVSPATFAEAEKEFRAQFKSPDQYQEYLVSDCHGSEGVLKQKIQRSLLIEQVMQTDIQAKSVVTPAQAKLFYDKHPEEFRQPESFSIQTISFLSQPNPTPAQRAELKRRAEDAWHQAKTTTGYEQFGVLAEKISEDDYRVMMGDHRAVRRDDLPPEVVAAALKMEPGHVSDLLQLGDDYTVVRLNAHTSAQLLKFEDVRDSLIDRLQKRKTEQLRSTLDKRLRSKAKVEEL
jgi:peptidyl-prolyl cis-trans isomerase C